MPTTRASFRSGAVIVSKDEELTRSAMILQGMAARSYPIVGKPDHHVITAIHIAGDFLDLKGFALGHLRYRVISMGPTSVEFVAHDELKKVIEDFPDLAHLLWQTTATDAAIHEQWLVAAASLRSTAHLAHLICELYTRQNRIGAAQGGRLTLPILQRELAEILGYSPIHINRAVRDLRDRELVRWLGAEVEILDWDELSKLARFDPQYLNENNL
ncbi:Crp/Fnr family transcriptional regulator [Paracoccus sp. (in: a-proteobacteria)]|uniref:Crp/Fnr family transcriptional regulator n=1 Tax=Paracoccus sp. TaxID=267 RepID=UPI00289692A5|nr:Crp/Fnr family transcriptional regulator [Paracoccus sp. (in: a-proteobacteria)]